MMPTVLASKNAVGPEIALLVIAQYKIAGDCLGKILYGRDGFRGRFKFGNSVKDGFEGFWKVFPSVL